MEQENYLLPEWQADNLITEIKDLQADKERFTEVAKKKCEIIMGELETRSLKIDNEIEFKKAQLRAYFMTVERKSTKTQETYSMFSGKLVMKKPTQKIKHDEEKLKTYLLNNAEGYLKEIVTTKIDWAEFKKELVVDNGNVFNKTTGQYLDDREGITLEDVAESFEVK